MEHHFQKIWSDYISSTPTALKAYKALNIDAPLTVNDHIAFRTINSANIGIHKLAYPFILLGYQIKGFYTFKKKKLRAIHLENTTFKDAPKIFISELMTHTLSSKNQFILKNCFETLPPLNTLDDLSKGRLWPVEYDIYKSLLKESEYAAWLYINGMKANHFTIDLRQIETSINDAVQYMKLNKIKLNDSGEIIKGTPSKGLQQFSTIADKVSVKFIDRKEPIRLPGSYIEFAYRHKIKGELFTGFITDSANLIFESTDVAAA